MVELPKTIAVISKSLIRAAQVIGSDLQDPIEMEWKPELLRKAFSIIKSRYQAARIRLVLDEEMHHTLDLAIPAISNESEERTLVESKLKEQLPEVLTAGNWDYKIKSATDLEKTVTVFVPVQELFLAITDAATKEGLEIEAVEPINISLERDPNPFLGMAKKTDLRGDDDEVLNIQPIFAAPASTNALTQSTTTVEPVIAPPPVESSMPVATESKKSLNKWVIFAVVALLIGLIAFGVVKAINTKTPIASASPTPIPTLAPSPSPSSSPVPIDSLKLQVLNGSGVVGQAGFVAGKLETAGFAKAETGNADKYGYKDTLVSLKSSVPESVFEEIVTALGSGFSVKQSDPLESSSDFDISIIVGSNKLLPSPTATPKASPSPSVSPRSSASPSPSGSASPSPSPSGSGSPSPSPSSSAT